MGSLTKHVLGCSQTEHQIRSPSTHCIIHSQWPLKRVRSTPKPLVLSDAPNHSTRECGGSRRRSYKKPRAIDPARNRISPSAAVACILPHCMGHYFGEQADYDLTGHSLRPFRKRLISVNSSFAGSLALLGRTGNHLRHAHSATFVASTRSSRAHSSCSLISNDGGAADSGRLTN